MSESTRSLPHGRRQSDLVDFRFDLKRAVLWVSLITAIATGSNYLVSCVGGRVVSPAALTPVRDSVRLSLKQQEVTTQALVRVNVRLDSVNNALAQFADIAETMAIDICLRRRSDPYALRKLNCQRYLGGD